MRRPGEIDDRARSHAEVNGHAVRAVILGALTLVVAAGCGASTTGNGEPSVAASSAAPVSPSSTSKAVSDTFASAVPPNAPGQQLTLYHVDVPVGAVIAPHQHPGQQVSHVTAGTLTYTVLSGTVTVFDAPVDGKPGPSHKVTGPATIEVRAGQSLTEPAGEIHRAANRGTVPVRIDIAVLVPKGDPISVPEKR
jgi:quercetin dioxygenase-like cupin family protein